jgi:hypothetical protein
LMSAVTGGLVGDAIRKLLAVVVNLVVVPCKLVRSVVLVVVCLALVVASSFLERRSALPLLLPSVSCACADRLGLPRL